MDFTDHKDMFFGSADEGVRVSGNVPIDSPECSALG